MVKEALGDELMTAIRTVHAGRSCINATLGAAHDEVSEELNSHELLSPREQQVLELLAQGSTNQEIAGQLHVSAKTVGTYRGRLGEKLGLRSRAENVRFALRCGLLPPPSVL